MNRKLVKNCQFSLITLFFSSSSRSYCALSFLIQKTAHNFKNENVHIGHDMQVKINDIGIKISDNLFKHAYFHGPMPRFFKLRAIYSSIELIIMNVRQAVSLHFSINFIY